MHAHANACILPTHACCQHMHTSTHSQVRECKGRGRRRRRRDNQHVVERGRGGGLARAHDSSLVRVISVHAYALLMRRAGENCLIFVMI